MNVIAGILIGIFNDSWLARILIPLAWGLVFYLYRVLRVGSQPVIVSRNTGDARGVATRGQFFKVEYLTAVTTALLFSLLAGIVKAIFT